MKISITAKEVQQAIVEYIEKKCPAHPIKKDTLRVLIDVNSLGKQEITGADVDIQGWGEDYDYEQDVSAVLEIMPDFIIDDVDFISARDASRYKDNYEIENECGGVRIVRCKDKYYLIYSDDLFKLTGRYE